MPCQRHKGRLGLLPIVILGIWFGPAFIGARPVSRRFIGHVASTDLKEGVKMKSDSDANSDSAAESNGEFWNLSGDERSIGRRSMLDSSGAVLALGLVTVLWGSQHSIIKYTLAGGANDSLQAACLNLVRFSLASLCFSFWLPDLRGLRGRLEWRAGLELGFWLFLGFCLQAIGLVYTTAQRSGLLLYLNVKLVPFFAFSIFGREVALSAWLSALAALLGTTLVALDDQAGVPPNVGDLLSLMAAAASAMFILRLETFAPVTEPKAVNAVSTLSVAALCFFWAFAVAAASFLDTAGASPAPELITGSALAELGARCGALLRDQLFSVIYLGVLTTAFTNWLQTIGQQSIPATTASAIYALDPLWGAFFAYLFLGEALGPQGLLGCFILFAVWLYQLAATKREEANTSDA
ncbi:unnamed protein product [Effrenium voratum]|nr:unnamed protein product [Effrenium voratum]